MNAADRFASQRERGHRDREQSEAQPDQPALVPLDEHRSDGETAEASAEAPRGVEPLVWRDFSSMPKFSRRSQGTGRRTAVRSTRTWSGRAGSASSTGLSRTRRMPDVTAARRPRAKRASGSGGAPQQGDDDEEVGHRVDQEELRGRHAEQAEPGDDDRADDARTVDHRRVQRDRTGRSWRCTSVGNAAAHAGALNALPIPTPS